jgi:hypothetical protein
MSHPCVVTLERDSAPRLLFSNDRLIEVDLPAGTRVIYPKPPISPLKDPKAAIRYAINHPENSEPLYARLRPGMKVTIAMDDISLPLPPMRRPDVRQMVLEVVLELLAEYGVDDYEMIIATGIHRKMRDWEVRHMVGDKIFDAHWPDRLYNFDAEDRPNLVELGRTEHGEVIEINRRAAESDLLIYVNINLVAMDGGHKSVICGLTSYRSLAHHHNPETIRACHSYMDPDPKSSRLHDIIWRMGRVANKELKVFTIESTINNKMFDDQLSFLQKNEDDFTTKERWLAKGIVAATARLPQGARQAIFDKFPAPYGLIGVNAGETEAVHKKTLERVHEQYVVPVEGQADVVVCGLPFIMPYNVHSFMNPLLVSCFAEGYVFNLHKSRPLVKKGGTLIITHPCSDKFDYDQHATYIDFVHKILPETRDAAVMREKYERKMAEDPAFIHMYRTGHVYHPAHPFFMWYWGENGRQHLGRVIVVGADNEYIPRLLGYETAATMDDALYMARGGESRSLDITLLRLPPIVMADVGAGSGGQV